MKNLGRWVWIHLKNGHIVRGILKGMGKTKIVLEDDSTIFVKKIKKITYYKKEK